MLIGLTYCHQVAESLESHNAATSSRMTLAFMQGLAGSATKASDGWEAAPGSKQKGALHGVLQGWALLSLSALQLFKTWLTKPDSGNLLQAEIVWCTV